MSITQEIDLFASFAKQIAEQQGQELTLDDAYQQWRAIDQTEIEVLRQRLESYDAGERGRPANEVMDELRLKMSRKYGAE